MMKTSTPPFKKITVKNGTKYRMEKIMHDTKEGFSVDIIHPGGNYLTVDIRSIYKTTSGRQGNKRAFAATFCAEEVVHLASMLFYIADNHLRDSSQQPYYSIVTSPDKAAMGMNWICEDYKTAAKRTALRESRSYVFNLMKQFVETCEDNILFSDMAAIFIEWGESTQNPFLKNIAHHAKEQTMLY